MSITIDNCTAEIFKIYDELTQKFIKELEGCKVIIHAVEEMIDQKERKLQRIKTKTLALLKEDVHFPEITASEKASLMIVYENLNDSSPERKS